MANEVAALGLKVDPSGIAEGIKALDDLAARGPKAEKAMDAVGESAAKASKSLKTLGQGSAKGLEDVGNAAPKAAESVGRLSKSAENANSSLSKISTSAAGLGNVATASAQSAKSVDSLSASLAQTQKTLAQMQMQLQTASGATSSLGSAQVDAARNASNVAGAYRAAGEQVSAYARAPEQAAMANQRFAKSMDATGLSAKQTAAALRGVPAQFTDIVVSLQSGQAPLTVLLQQGGQLKDMFGGAGAAARALGGYVLGLITPMTLLAAGVAAVGVAYYQGSKEADVFRATLAKTGNAAGVTAGVLQDYARQMAETSGTQGKAAETLNLFVAAGVRAQDNLVRFASTAQEWEKATGEGIDAVAQKYVALQKDPLSAAMKLNEGMNFLTVSVYDQIKALEEQGKATEAAQLAMEALDSAMAERAKNIEQNLGYIERAWNGITSGAKKAWDAMLDVGRPDTTVDKIRKIQEQIDQRMTQPLAVDNPAMQASREKSIANLQRELMALQALHAQEELGAAGDAERLRQVQARADWGKITAGNLDKQAKMEAELTKVREAALQAGISGKELEDQLAAVREKYATKTVASSKATVSAYQSLMVAINESIAASKNELNVGEKLTESQKLRVRYEQELATRKRAFTKQQKESIEIALREAEAAESAVMAAENAAKAYEEGLKWKAEWYAAQGKNLKEIKSANNRIREEIQLIGLSQDAQQALERTRIEATLTVREQHLAEMQRSNDANQFSSIEQQNLEMEIALLKERLGLLDDKRVRTANVEAAKELEKQWDKTSQTVGDTLADYIMGGGKDAAQYLERLFSTLVLEPVVKTVVGNAMGSMGLGDQPSGAAGGGFDVLSAGKGLFDAWSGSTGGMLASGVSALGSLTGSVFLGELGSAVAAGVELGISGAAALTSSASATTTAGMWLGAAAPWVAGIGALLSIVPSFLNGGTPHAGAGSMYYGGRIAESGPGYSSRAGVTDTYQKEMQAPVDALAMSIGSALDGLAKQFDQAVGYSVQVGFKSDNDDPSAGKYIIADPTGEIIRKWEAYRGGEFGGISTGERYDSDPTKGFDQYLQSVTAATIPIVQGIVPGWADNLLNQLSESLGIAGALASGEKNPWKQMSVSGQEAFAALQQTLAQIAQIDAAFDALGKTMSVFSGLTDDMKSALLGGLGGIEGFSAAAQTYYAAYYSEQERYTEALARMQEAMAGIGVDIDPAMGSEAKAQYRALVESAFADGNEVLATQLLALSGAFAQTADAAQEQAQAAQEAAQAIAQQWKDLETRAMAVQDKYRTPEQRVAAQYDSIAGGLIGAGLSNMQQGDLSAMLMQSSKDEIYALAQEVWNLGHLSIEARNALLDAADALADLKDAAQQQRDGLMATLWQMTGNTQALRDKELAALDPANRALQVLIYTLGDLQNAAAEAAQKTQAAWSSWSTASSLAMQYTGDTSGMQAQAAILRAQLGSAGVVDTAKLQELIGIEQALFNHQQKQQEEERQLQAQITQERLSGLRDELAAARALADAAKRLGDYARDLYSSGASGLSESDRMAALFAEYGTLKSAARSGNVDAFGKLQSITGDYLGLAGTLASSGSDYSITAGRMAAELEALAKAQELVGQSQATGIEQQMEQLTAQTLIAQEQFEVSAEVKALITKSMQEQADIWDRENTQLENLLALQDRAALYLSTMPMDFGKTMSPLISGAANNIAQPISARLDMLLSALSPSDAKTGSVRVPAYAVGTNVVPRDMLAQIHEGEAIIPKAFNPWAGGAGFAGGSADQALIAEIRALREQNARLEERLHGIERSSQQLADQFDNVTVGGNAMAVEVMA